MTEVYFHYLELSDTDDQCALLCKRDIQFLLNQHSGSGTHFIHKIKNIKEKMDILNFEISSVMLLDFAVKEFKKANDFHVAFENTVVHFYIQPKINAKIPLTISEACFLSKYVQRTESSSVQVIMRAYFFDHIKYVIAKIWNGLKQREKESWSIVLSLGMVCAIIYFPSIRKFVINDLNDKERAELFGGIFTLCILFWQAPKTKTTHI